MLRGQWVHLLSLYIWPEEPCISTFLIIHIIISNHCCVDSFELGVQLYRVLNKYQSWNDGNKKYTNVEQQLK